MEKKKNKIEEIEVELDNHEDDDDFGKKKITKKEPIEEIDDDYEELSVEDRLFNIEKKVNTNLIISVITIILVIITMIFAMTNKNTGDGTGNTGTGSSSNSGSGSSGETKYNYSIDLFDEIEPANIAKESKGKTIVVMIGRQTCSACAVYAPTLALLQEEYDFTTKYIDFSKMITSNGNTAYISDEAGYDALTSLTGNGYDGWVEENFGTTPLTLIIKDNKILYAVVGAVEDSTLTPQFEKFGINKK